MRRAPAAPVPVDAFVDIPDHIPEPTETLYRIQHRYDLGDQGVYIELPARVDAARIAAYIQFMAEGWFGPEKLVTNLGIASALVAFYGARHAARGDHAQLLDMHDERDKRVEFAFALTGDRALVRHGLRDYLRAHVEG